MINIHKFVSLLRQADRIFRDEKPDAVVLIDYPGFHWWLARRAKARGIPVVYYVPPQLWAWAGWRVKKVRRYVDLVLCSLPFEPLWYAARGVPNAVYVGHPYFDEVADRVLDAAFLNEQEERGGPIVAILPGSRTQEITRNFPVMLRAAAALAKERPDVRFAVACLHDRHRTMAAELVREAGLEHLPIELYSGRTAELIRRADLAWSVSGSVSLELMAEALPTVILYTIKPLDLFVARPFIKSRFITLVNLLAGSEIMPEYLTDRDESAELVRWGLEWLNDRRARDQVSVQLAELRDRVARPGASERAADQICNLLAQPRSQLAGPHRQGTPTDQSMAGAGFAWDNPDRSAAS